MLFFFWEDKVCAGGDVKKLLLLLTNDTELKHVVGLIKLPPKTLPTVPDTPDHSSATPAAHAHLIEAA
jgi:hypothetical protein